MRQIYRFILTFATPLILFLIVFKYTRNHNQPRLSSLTTNSVEPPVAITSTTLAGGLESTEVYMRRQEMVRQVCQQYGGQLSYGALGDVPLTQLRWLLKRNMVMCFTAKVGTSTWLSYLLDELSPDALVGRSNYHATALRLLVPPGGLTSNETLALLLEAKTVMSVRHPFVRLVSAYLDKISSSDCAVLGRCEDIASEKKSFNNFIRYLIKSLSLPISLTNNAFQAVNRHFRPYYLNCAPCDISYDYIVHLETFEQDQRFIFNTFNFSEHSMKHQNVMSASNKTIQYFKLLTHNTILALYERYKIDFDMFGYAAQEYLEL